MATTQAVDASAELRAQVAAAKAAAPALGWALTEQKNAVLYSAASMLRTRTSQIVAANEEDVSEASGHLSEAMVDRLRLTSERVEGLASSLEELVELDDPVGETIDRDHDRLGARDRTSPRPLGGDCLGLRVAPECDD